MTPDTSPKLEIDWLKTAGGAFAAVSSAFLLSTLGAAGTIIGAALGSVIVTVGGAVYSQGLARSHQRLAGMQYAGVRRAGVPRAEVPHDAEGDRGSTAGDPPAPGWRERFVVLPWKRIALVAAGLFLAVVLVITVFELAVGKSVSSITGGTDGSGGTTISRIGGGSGEPSQDDDDPQEEQSSPSEAPSGEPTDEPAPTTVPTDEPTPTPQTPTPATTPSEPSETSVPTEPAPTSPTG